ncbi:MAG: hypothetical protein ACOC7W_08505, partial [Desulfosalsimonas sp.]
ALNVASKTDPDLGLPWKFSPWAAARDPLPFTLEHEHKGRGHNFHLQSNRYWRNLVLKASQ